MCVSCRTHGGVCAVRLTARCGVSVPCDEGLCRNVELFSARGDFTPALLLGLWRERGGMTTRDRLCAPKGQYEDVFRLD